MLTGEAAPDGPARDLLLRLDYLDGVADHASHRAALLRAAAGFHRLFTLEAEDAPGLVVLGAEVDPACVGVADAPLGSVSGAALTFRQAFEACVGEGVEYLSQFATIDNEFEQLPEAAAFGNASAPLQALWQRLRPYRRDSARQHLAWATALDLADGTPVRLPADICFRRPMTERDIDPPWPLSTGCGAGSDYLSATLHGLLELIERDSAALWWRGGQRARLLSDDVGAPVLALLRTGHSERRTWLLDITSEIGVPVVVAASCYDDGFGLCCGVAARATLASAAEAALREMAQMELGYRISISKVKQRGEAALNDTDRQHIRRFTSLNVAETPALQPMAPPRLPHDLPASNQLAQLAELRRRLHAAGVAPCAVNLTRAIFGIPVIRVLCPGLELGMTAPPGPRLLAAAACSGIDPTAAVPLL
jgi:ribosomal protein S12 methylthiotransferase accessory factor